MLIFASWLFESLWILAFSARSLKLTAALCPSYSRVKQKYRCVACRKIEKKRLEMAKLNILHQVKISNWLNLTFVCNHCHECKSMNAERGDFNLKSELRSPKSAHHVPWCLGKSWLALIEEFCFIASFIGSVPASQKDQIITYIINGVSTIWST